MTAKHAMIALICALVITTHASGENGGIHLREGINGQPIVAMDILQAFRNDRVQEAGTFAKLPVAVWEGTKATGRYAVDSPANFAKSVVVGYVVVRGFQGKIGDDWDSVRESVGLKSSSSKSKSDAGRRDASDDAQSVTVIENNIAGDGNTINQTIVVQQPQGSNTGATPNNNSGSGGQHNSPGE